MTKKTVENIVFGGMAADLAAEKEQQLREKKRVYTARWRAKKAAEKIAAAKIAAENTQKSLYRPDFSNFENNDFFAVI